MGVSKVLNGPGDSRTAIVLPIIAEIPVRGKGNERERT